MSKYTSGRTTQKRDKCIQRKQSEISALQAENAALRAKVAELEKQLDSLSNSYATCGNPGCTPTQVCELFFDGCRS